MLSGWTQDLLTGIITVNQIFTAGIAITAFSLFLYALSFNLRDRVARSFAIILLCVVTVFTSEALESASTTPLVIDLFLRLEWLGIIFLPAAYLHLSDAILVTTGQPSRGRRRLAVTLTYSISAIFILMLALGYLLGPLVMDGNPAPYLQRTLGTEIFTAYYVLVMVLAWINFGRAFRRTLTRSGRRRMLYLLAGAAAPALGSFPYLLYGSGLAANFPFLFWGAATATLNPTPLWVMIGFPIPAPTRLMAFVMVTVPDQEALPAGTRTVSPSLAELMAA